MHRSPARIVPRVPAVPRRDWSDPRARVRRIRDRLREVYGIPAAPPHGRPLDELILTVLSQSTNDRNRDVAFLRLRAPLPVLGRRARRPVEEVEEAIRPGGISKVKSQRIQAILRALDDPPSPDHVADHVEDRPRRADARCRASAARPPPACCCSPTACRDVPVDTHVSRVGTRLGLFRPRRRSRSCTTTMLAFTPRGQELELHVNLLRHGRRTCHAQRPPRLRAAAHAPCCADVPDRL